MHPQAKPPRPLCRCRVMYLGAQVPHVSKNGLHGIQAPLKALYPTSISANSFLKTMPTANATADQPADATVDISSLVASCDTAVDSWLSVWSNGLLLQTNDATAQRRSNKKFFAIESLHYCAAVRYFNTKNLRNNSAQQTISNSSKLANSNLDHNNNDSTDGVAKRCLSATADRSLGARFLPLDAPLFAQMLSQSMASEIANHPPIFAAIMRRTSGVKVLQCHVFICRRDAAANALVNCCLHAFANNLHALSVAQQQHQSQALFWQDANANRYCGSELDDSGHSTAQQQFDLTLESSNCSSPSPSFTSDNNNNNNNNNNKYDDADICSSSRNHRRHRSFSGAKFATRDDVVDCLHSRSLTALSASRSKSERRKSLPASTVQLLNRKPVQADRPADRESIRRARLGSCQFESFRRAQSLPRKQNSQTQQNSKAYNTDEDFVCNDMDAAALIWQSKPRVAPINRSDNYAKSTLNSNYLSQLQAPGLYPYAYAAPLVGQNLYWSSTTPMLQQMHYPRVHVASTLKCRRTSSKKSSTVEANKANTLVRNVNLSHDQLAATSAALSMPSPMITVYDAASIGCQFAMPTMYAPLSSQAVLYSPALQAQHQKLYNQSSHLQNVQQQLQQQHHLASTAKLTKHSRRVGLIAPNSSSNKLGLYKRLQHQLRAFSPLLSSSTSKAKFANVAKQQDLVVANDTKNSFVRRSHENGDSLKVAEKSNTRDRSWHRRLSTLITSPSSKRNPITVGSKRTESPQQQTTTVVVEKINVQSVGDDNIQFSQNNDATTKQTVVSCCEEKPESAETVERQADDADKITDESISLPIQLEIGDATQRSNSASDPSKNQ